jgi:hypothetical protein
MGSDIGLDDLKTEMINAKWIEIGGPNAKDWKHPVIVVTQQNKPIFCEADMEKVDAFERERQAAKADKSSTDQAPDEIGGKHASTETKET